MARKEDNPQSEAPVFIYGGPKDDNRQNSNHPFQQGPAETDYYAAQQVHTAHGAEGPNYPESVACRDRQKERRKKRQRAIIKGIRTAILATFISVGLVTKSSEAPNNQISAGEIGHPTQQTPPTKK